MNESTPATAHTTVCRRLTGIPSRLARSARSALARTAMPMLLKRSIRATPSRATGAMISATTSSAVKTNGKTVKVKEMGTCTTLLVGC